MRVYQLAKDLQLSSKEVIEQLGSIGCQVSSHMAQVSADVVEKLKRKLAPPSTASKAPNKENSPKNVDTNTKPKPEVAKVIEKVTTPTPKSSTEFTKPMILQQKKGQEFKDLDTADEKQREIEQFFEHDLDELEESITRHSRFPRTGGDSSASRVRRGGGRFKRRRKGRSQAEEPAQAVAVSTVIIDGDVVLSQLAKNAGKSIAEVILYFLKKGKAYTLNQLISKNDALSFVKDAGLEAIVQDDKPLETKGASLRSVKASDKADARTPIVVVMGHVDHGKTSLLDFIRKSSVAAGEVGGITQKISAYQVNSKHGNIIFIDTPGHEAFTLMRRCGTRITDIAMIVIAADDGIMPQTQEAIELAKKANAQIIVALNKVDKPGLEKNIENIKNQLAKKHDLLVEEWGGDLVLVPVSAKTGQGVDELLEMIVLQSELMGLQGHKNRPGRAFVLESNFQKGLGPVSTVIVTEGEISQGDSFVVGNTFGKVRVLEDVYGKSLKKAGPSTLVKLVGFENLADPGDVLSVVDARSINRKNTSASVIGAALQGAAIEHDKSKLNIMVKVGTSGSLDAASKAFEKASAKNPELAKSLVIKRIAVGDVSCGDVVLAEDFGAEILVFAAGIDRNAAEMAATKKIKISSYSIIYELIDAVEERIKQLTDQETIYKECGRAQVIKVFDIKGKGVIAGCKVTDGRFVRNGKVVCMRGDKKISESDIASLQHSKKAVSEVKKGFECGFMANKFDDWREGDLVLCLEPIKRGQLTE